MKKEIKLEFTLPHHLAEYVETKILNKFPEEERREVLDIALRQSQETNKTLPEVLKTMGDL